MQQLTPTHGPFHDFRPLLSPERLNSPSVAFEKTRNRTKFLPCNFNSTEVKVVRTMNYITNKYYLVITVCLENFKTEKRLKINALFFSEIKKKKEQCIFNFLSF